ncbi:MAG: hypothetical protein HYT85_07815 [candidate division NC10 bacterium]|nr:hypothetical protein [candidate division NC10 bacterium]
MPFVLFHDHFPEIAERETRTITVLEQSPAGLPPGHYALLEMYCDEAGCDCRRAFFYVVSSMRKDVEAVIVFGWERPEFYAEWMKDDDPKVIGDLRGPVLNFGSPQSRLAPAILQLVKDVVLKDEQYVQRLQTHYWMFRHRMDSGSGSKAPKKKGRA